MGCTPPSSQTQAKGRHAASPGCAQTLICTQSRVRFFSLTYPLLRPQIMYDRPSATQHLIALVEHLPKVPFAPGHLAQRPDQGETKTLWSSYGSRVLQGLIPKKAPTCLISAWPESSSWHPNQHIQPSDQVSCTPSAAAAQLHSCSSCKPTVLSAAGTGTGLHHHSPALLGS